MSKRVLLVLGIVLVLLTGMVTGSAAGTERSRTVNLGMDGKLLSLDPHNFKDRDSELALRMTYETLVDSDHAGSYYPLLAKDWDIAPDGTSWTFYLNEGILFHNGEPLTADDVVYSVERVTSRKGDLQFCAAYLPELVSAEKIDEYTVKINFSQPAPLVGAGFRSFMIIPQEAHQQYGDDLFYDQHQFGTGPWMFEEWVDGQFVHYFKNENYWNKAEFDSYFNEVYIRFLEETSSAIAAHIAGNVDTFFTGSLSADAKAMYAGTESRIELVTYPTNRTNWFGLSFKEGSIWNDEKTRKAWDAAIDRQAMIDSFLPNEIVPHGFFAPGVEGYDPNLPNPVYDPELAKQLLSESSYDGRPFTLMISADETMGEEKGLVLMDMVNSVGFNMNIDIVDFSTFSPRQQSGDYDIFLIQTGQGNGVPKRALQRIPGNFDHADYVNPEMNEIINSYGAELDPDKRAEFARQANEMIFELKAPHISLLHTPQIQAINYGIVGLNLNPDGEYQFHYVDWDPSKLP